MEVTDFHVPKKRQCQDSNPQGTTITYDTTVYSYKGFGPPRPRGGLKVISKS